MDWYTVSVILAYDLLYEEFSIFDLVYNAKFDTLLAHFSLFQISALDLAHEYLKDAIIVWQSWRLRPLGLKTTGSLVESGESDTKEACVRAIRDCWPEFTVDTPITCVFV